MKQKNFVFMPARVAAKHPLPTDGSISFNVEMTLQTTDGFHTSGSVLIGEEEAISAFAEKSGLTVCGSSVMDERLYLILGVETPADDFVITHELLGDEEENLERDTRNYPLMLNDARDTLRRFAGQTGFKPVLHFRRKPVCNPFTDGDEDTLHIIVGASPPGAVDSVDRQHICGVRLHAKNYWRRCNGPTAGRGTVLKDDNKTKVAQVEGRNVFLFTPVIDLETGPLFSSEGGNLIRRLMELVSRAFVEGIEPDPETAIESSDAFRDYLAKRIIKEFDNLDEMIEGADAKMEAARETYRDAMSSRRNYLVLREGIQAHIMGRVDEHAAADWARLTADPRIGQTRLLDLALHVRTKRIIYEEEGKRYDLGEFMIRLRIGGEVSVWAVSPTHPKGLAHPHISERSSFCFGNAGIEIEKAAAQLRLADAIGLVLEWLTNGYDATLATHKIEEWPELKEAA